MPPFIGYLHPVPEKEPEGPLTLEQAKFSGRCRICAKKIHLTVSADYPQEFDKVAGDPIPLGNNEFLVMSYSSEYAHASCLIHGKPVLAISGRNLK